MVISSLLLTTFMSSHAVGGEYLVEIIMVLLAYPTLNWCFPAMMSTSLFAPYIVNGDDKRAIEASVNFSLEMKLTISLQLLAGHSTSLLKFDLSWNLIEN